MISVRAQLPASLSAQLSGLLANNEARYEQPQAAAADAAPRMRMNSAAPMPGLAALDVPAGQLQNPVAPVQGTHTAAHDDQTPNNACPICLDALDNGAPTVSTPCEQPHQYHRDCLTEWVARQPECPTCRHSLQEFADHLVPASVQAKKIFLGDLKSGATFGVLIGAAFSIGFISPVVLFLGTPISNPITRSAFASESSSTLWHAGLVGTLGILLARGIVGSIGAAAGFVIGSGRAIIHADRAAIGDTVASFSKYSADTAAGLTQNFCTGASSIASGAIILVFVATTVTLGSIIGVIVGSIRSSVFLATGYKEPREPVPAEEAAAPH